MITIKTSLSETGFQNRMNDLTVPYTFFNPSYRESDCFALKAKNNSFCMGHHVKHVGRSDGYDAVFLYGKYFLDDAGKVTVRFRFGKPFQFTIPFIVLVTIAFPAFLGALYTSLYDHEMLWLPLFVTGVFSAFGFWQLFASSKKAKQLLIQRMERICNIEEKASYTDPQRQRKRKRKR